MNSNSQENNFVINNPTRESMELYQQTLFIYGSSIMTGKMCKSTTFDSLANMTWKSTNMKILAIKIST